MRRFFSKKRPLTCAFVIDFFNNPSEISDAEIPAGEFRLPETIARRADSLEVIARPVFARSEHDRLVGLQRLHGDRAGSPHFTLVFPGSTLKQHEFIAEVRAAVDGVRRIAFILRSAVVVAEPQVRAFHVFLVPDQGFGAIVRLHEKLHAGGLSVCLPHGFTYIPHLTVASIHGYGDARGIAAGLNAAEFSIGGRIDTLEVHSRGGGLVHCAAEIALEKAGIFS